MYGFIFFNIENKKVTKCAYLVSKEITSKNYNFDKDRMTIDEFSNFIENIDDDLEVIDLSDKKLYNTYKDLMDKEYQRVLMKTGKSRYTRVLKVPYREIESIITKKKVSKRKIIQRNSLFGKKVIAKASLSTILLLSGVVANAKVKRNLEEKVDEKIIETQEDIITSSDIDSLLGQINSIVSKMGFKDILKIPTENWVNTEKYEYCYNNYYPIIEKYSSTYGIDPTLALAIACHERGYHSEEVDNGGGLGLYQIQVEGSWNWDNKEISAYNFDTNSTETYVIKKDKVRNIDDNIKVGLMIFQSCLRRNDYNIAKAVTEYNYGSTYLDKTINDACFFLDKNKSYFNDINHLEWLDYRNYGGDPNYLENVFKYIDDGKVLTFKKVDGQNESIMFHNMSNDLEIASTNKKR